MTKIARLEITNFRTLPELILNSISNIFTSVLKAARYVNGTAEIFVLQKQCDNSSDTLDV